MQATRDSPPRRATLSMCSTSQMHSKRQALQRHVWRRGQGMQRGGSQYALGDVEALLAACRHSVDDILWKYAGTTVAVGSWYRALDCTVCSDAWTYASLSHGARLARMAFATFESWGEINWQPLDQYTL